MSTGLEHSVAYRTTTGQFVFCAAFCAPFFVAAATTHGMPIFRGGFVAFLLALLWRARSDGIYVEDTGIKSVALLISRHFTWSQIESFAVVRGPRGNDCAAIILHSGRSLPCLALSVPRFPKRRAEHSRARINRQVSELNSVLERRRVQTSSPS